MIFCHIINIILHLRHFFTPTSLPVLHLRHFRFYTYVTSGFTPTSFPVLYLRHFRFYTYITSGFTTTSLFYTYVQTHDLSKLSFFLHLFSLLEKSDVTIWFYTKFWSIQKKIKNALFVTILQRLFQKLPQKSNF